MWPWRLLGWLGPHIPVAPDGSRTDVKLCTMVNSCENCGALVSEERKPMHEEWHKAMWAHTHAAS